MRAYGSLRRRADFTRLYRRGKFVAGRFLSLYGLRDRGTGGRPLLGLAVGKEIGNAVERNRLRRRTKALFDRLDLSGLPTWRFVVVAKPGSAGAPFGLLAEELNASFVRVCGLQ